MSPTGSRVSTFGPEVIVLRRWSLVGGKCGSLGVGEFEVHSLALLLSFPQLPGYLKGREAVACSCCHKWLGISRPQQ